MDSSSSSTSVNAYITAGWFSFYASGLIGTLMIYGILQERIMTLPYDDVKFKDSIFLVFINRIVGVIFAMCMIVAKGETLHNKAPLWKYLAISFSNVYASTCQYEALKYVSFPVQMLGKSFKMMPVMAWGMAVSGKSYELKDWLIAFAVTGGVVEFLMTGPIASGDDTNSSMYGLMYIGLFLLLDGFTSTFQEKLFKDHVTSKYNQMLYVNLGSCVLSSSTLLASNHLGSALAFATAHPQFVVDAMTLSGSAVSGQWFIYSQVKEFGAVAFAATMNVRQIVSILVSYWRFGHSTNPLQMFGIFIVFAALFYKSYIAMMAPAKNVEAANETQPNDETKALLQERQALSGVHQRGAPEIKV